MEHAKKLMLVEPRFYRPTIGEKTLGGLDDEVRRALNSDAPDDQKAKMYAMALKNYRSVAAHVDDAEEKREDEKNEKKEAFNEKDVLQSIAFGERHKAKRLLDYIKRSADANFDHNGELTHRQRHLPNTDLLELIDNVLSKRSERMPEGLDEFVEVLKEVKVPPSLITNEQLLQRLYPTGVAAAKSKRVRTSKKTPPTTIHRVTAPPLSGTRLSSREKREKKSWIEY